MKLGYWGVAAVLEWLCLVLVCETKPLNHLNWLKISSHRKKRQASYPTPTTTSATITPYPTTTNGTAFRNSSSSPNADCSQNLTGTYGRFSSPGAGSSYSPNLDCLYTIPSPPAGSQIDITFQLFHLEAHSSCGYDFVSFSYNSQKICGHKTTPLSYPFVSQERDFQILFHSDGSAEYPGFIATFRIQARLNWTPSVSTVTPWYYRTTPPYTSYPPTGSAQRPSTTYNPWLTWTTGASTVTPWYYRTTPPYTSYPTTTNGTAFWNSSSSPNADCSQNLTGTYGRFSSPGAGSSYSPNLDCLYTIPSPPAGSQIDITFQLFHLEAHSSCGYDFVSFSYNSQKICGQRATPLSYSFVSQERDFQILFHSDGSAEYPGFIATFRIQARLNWTPSVSTVTPWYYRTTPPYTSYPPTGSAQRPSTTYNPWLTWTTGASTVTPWYYRTTPPYTSYPTTTNGTAFWNSSSSPNADCSQNLTGTYGRFSSPGAGSSYSPNLDCLYTIPSPPAGSQIDITFQLFHLEAHSSCGYDFVSFSYNSQKICGQKTTPLSYPFVSRERDFQIHFHTDGSVQYSGFIATFTIRENVPTTTTTTTTTTRPPIPNCNATFTAASGQFRSPNSPHNYPNNVYCRYTFVGSGQTQSISLDFTSFAVENHASCRWDWVIINGGNKRCGFTEFTRIYTFIGNFTVEFRTDGSVTYSGFVANYVVSDAPNATTPAPSNTATCTATLSSSSGTIMSPPGGGSNYLDNTRCYYTFTATSYPRTITFTFTTFQLESHSTCRYDYVQFNRGIKKCGTISNLVYTDTMYSQYRVTFYTDGSVTRRGFVATYQISDVINAASTIPPSTVPSNNGVCSTTLTSSTGRIYYPATATYGNNVRCQVTIRPGAGQTFSVTFTDFDIENQSSCSYDSLVFRVNGVDSTKYCGRNRAGLTLNFPYISGDIVVDFRTDGSVTGRGFDLNFQVA